MSDLSQWQLVIIGSGEQRKELQEQIFSLNLEQQVLMREFDSNIEHWYQRASILLSTSRFEGFPNVVLEALSFGLPVIATDCPGASRELLDGYGVLIPCGDTESAAESLIELIKAPELRSELGLKASKRAQAYSPETISELWINQFSF